VVLPFSQCYAVFYDAGPPQNIHQNDKCKILPAVPRDNRVLPFRHLRRKQQDFRYLGNDSLRRRGDNILFIQD